MRTLRWGERTSVMGIVNVTPDSFSGDGLAPAGRPEDEIVAAALEQAREFVAAGADLLDVGAESTRPASVYGEHLPVDAEAEARLAIPVVAALAAELGERAMVSIDTTKGSVAEAALAAGAGMVNDVWAASRDPGTARAAAAAGAYFVAMHNKDVAEYPDGVLPEVVAWLNERAEAAASAGVAADRIVIDPGIGFGKTAEHSLEVLHRLGTLRDALDLPLLVGTSRKRFIGDILDGAPSEDRLEGTIASVVAAVGAGADIVRVHDVAPVVRAVRVADAIVRRRPAGETVDAGIVATESPLPGRITVTGIAARGRHGVSDEERSRDQPFEVDVTVAVDVGNAARGDDLAGTVNYAALHEMVMTQVEATTFHLLETLAASIGQAVLERWRQVTNVEVAVRKPEAPMPGPFSKVEVRVRLGR
jgi:dihydropteroate synthase